MNHTHDANTKLIDQVYVGFFSHASFPEINTSRKTIFNGECPDTKDLLGNEYRYLFLRARLCLLIGTC